MPNYCFVEVKFSGEKEKINSIVSHLQLDKKNYLDFNVLIPKPELVFEGLLNDDVIKSVRNYINSKAQTIEEAKALLEEVNKAFSFQSLLEKSFTEKRNEIEKYKDVEVEQKFNIVDWYKWNIEHWGTKWNAIDTKWKVIDNNENADLIINFETAWNPPYPIYEKLFEIAYEYNVKLVIEDSTEGYDPYFLYTRMSNDNTEVVNVIYIDMLMEAIEDLKNDNDDVKEYLKDVIGRYNTDKYIMVLDGKEYKESINEDNFWGIFKKYINQMSTNKM